MAWIESHTVLLRHRKTVSFALDLGIKPVVAVGHLTVLWHAALEQAEDGDLTNWGDNFIAAAAQWDGDGDKFCKALRDNKWLDGHLIHDWWDYAGKFLTIKYRKNNLPKLNYIRNLYEKGDVGDLDVENHAQTTHKPHLPNQPNLTNQTKEVEEFFSYFLLKTKKSFKLTQDARGLIGKRLKDGYLVDDMKKAVDNFVADTWEGRKDRLQLVYCIGIRNKIDNLEKWLNVSKKDARRLPA